MYFFANMTTELPTTAGRVVVKHFAAYKMDSTLNYWILTKCWDTMFQIQKIIVGHPLT